SGADGSEGVEPRDVDRPSAGRRRRVVRARTGSIGRRAEPRRRRHTDRDRRARARDGGVARTPSARAADHGRARRTRRGGVLHGATSVPRIVRCLHRRHGHRRPRARAWARAGGQGRISPAAHGRPSRSPARDDDERRGEPRDPAHQRATRLRADRDAHERRARAVIETDRLVLRRFTGADRETVAVWNADPLYTRHLAGVLTREQSDEAFDRWQRHWDERGFGLLAVTWKETGELIGRVGPQFHRSWPHDPEVGWALDPRWWNRGIASEAGAASVAWGFGGPDFGRVVSRTAPGDVPAPDGLRRARVRPPDEGRRRVGPALDSRPRRMGGRPPFRRPPRRAG